MTKMQKRMKRIFKEYKHSFDIIDTLLVTSFEMFCEFYENGDLDIVDWDADFKHKEAKSKMDHLYFYWKVLRPKHKKAHYKLLDYYYGKENYKVTFEDDNDGYSTMKAEKKFPDYKYDKFNKIEYFIDKCEQKNLELLIKIRNYLWT